MTRSNRDMVGSHLRDGGRAAAETEQLREAIREAHEVLKDLRTERRAVEQLVAGIERRVQRTVSTLIEEAVKRDIAALAKVTEKAMRESVAKVGREFDRLERILTGRDRPGQESLEEQFRRLQNGSGR